MLMETRDDSGLIHLDKYCNLFNVIVCGREVEVMGFSIPAVLNDIGGCMAYWIVSIHTF
jgi:hypothetical protein